MTLPGFLDMTFARAAAESLMTSTCTITRAAGDRVWDEESGIYIDAPRATVYSGRCKVQDNARSVNSRIAGERQAAIGQLELHLPIEGSGDVRRDDVARIDSNPLDPSLVGRELIVQSESGASMKTARRLPVEAVQ